MSQHGEGELWNNYYFNLDFNERKKHAATVMAITLLIITAIKCDE